MYLYFYLLFIYMYNHFLRSTSRFVGLIYVIIPRIILISKATFRHYCHAFGAASLLKVGSLLSGRSIPVFQDTILSIQDYKSVRNIKFLSFK